MGEMKPLEQLTLMDDYMFAQVMRNEDCLRPLLEAILQIKIASIKQAESQKSEKEGYTSRGIRMDLYVIDADGVLYDVEVQASDKKNLPKRTRYYGSMIDISTLRSGTDYNALKKTIIIFICNYDPFKLQRYLYTFKNLCVESPALALNDETYKIIVNTKGTVGDISEELREALLYLDQSIVTGSYSKLLDDRVNEVKASEERRTEYMIQWIRDQEIRDEGRMEGRNEGRNERDREMISKKLLKGWTPERIHLDDEYPMELILEVQKSLLTNTAG